MAAKDVASSLGAHHLDTRIQLAVTRRSCHEARGGNRHCGVLQEEEEKKPESNGSSAKDFEINLKELRKFIKDQLGGIDKKITNLQSESNQHSTEIKKIKLLLINQKDDEEKPSESDNKNEASGEEK